MIEFAVVVLATLLYFAREEHLHKLNHEKILLQISVDENKHLYRRIENCNEIITKHEELAAVNDAIQKHDREVRLEIVKKLHIAEESARKAQSELFEINTRLDSPEYSKDNRIEALEGLNDFWEGRVQILQAQIYRLESN